MQTLTAPSTAQAVLVAELHENQCDYHTDYFASKVTRRVFLGWSTHRRDLFAEMRKAAATFAETAHLGPGCGEYFARVILLTDLPNSNGGALWKGQSSPWHTELYGEGHTFPRDGKRFTTRAAADAWVAAQPAPEAVWNGDVLAEFGWEIVGKESNIEHREKYSMGSGYYLQAGSTYSGWRVRKQSLQYASGAEQLAHLEVPAPRTPEPSPTPAAVEEPTPEIAEATAAPAASLEERPERGPLWLRFAKRPSDATLFVLKAAGWRWSRPALAWYHQLNDANRAFATAIATGAPTASACAAGSRLTSDAVVLSFEARR